MLPFEQRAGHRERFVHTVIGIAGPALLPQPWRIRYAHRREPNDQRGVVIADEQVKLAPRRMLRAWSSRLVPPARST